MEIPRVSPSDAAQLLEQGYLYVDVRSVPEFEQAHPEGAINIPLLHHDPSMGMTPNPDFMAVFDAVVPKDAKLVIGCAAGGRSLRAAQILLQSGWENVVDQRAGFGGVRDQMSGALIEAGWADAGLPTASGTTDNSYDAQRKKAGLE